MLLVLKKKKLKCTKNKHHEHTQCSLLTSKTRLRCQHCLAMRAKGDEFISSLLYVDWFKHLNSFVLVLITLVISMSSKEGTLVCYIFLASFIVYTI